MQDVFNVFQNVFDIFYVWQHICNEMQVYFINGRMNFTHFMYDRMYLLYCSMYVIYCSMDLQIHIIYAAIHKIYELYAAIYEIHKIC